MTDLNNLGDHVDGTLIAESQSQKSTTSNAVDNLLSDATQLPLDITITANRTLTDDEFFGHLIFELSGSPAADFSLFLPASGEHVFIVRNKTGKICTIDAGVSGGTVVALQASLSGEFHSDGTSVISTSDPDILLYSAVAVDGAVDSFLFWDDSAGVLRRVLGDNLPGSGGSLGSGAFPFKGALVKLSANESISDSTETAIPWDAEEYDIGGWWVIGSPTRLTVPAGVTRVKLKAAILWDSVTDDRVFVRFSMNGSGFVGRGGTDLAQSASQPNINFPSPSISVVPGDYFEVEVFQASGVAANVLTNDQTWAYIEAVETTENGKSATVQTTDATQTVIAAEAMAADSAHTVRAYGHGREDATGDTYHFEIFGGARNEGGTSSAASSVTGPLVREAADAGAATWDATLVANDTSDEWEIKVTGEAAHTIDWTVTYFEIVQEV